MNGIALCLLYRQSCTDFRKKDKLKSFNDRQLVNLIAQVQSLHNSSGQEQVIVSYNEKVYGVYVDALGQ